MALRLHERTATQLAGLVRAGEVSSREVTEAHLARITEVNGRVNAVTVALSDSALAAAAVADRLQRSGASLGPLHGVPFTVKESIDCLGSATTYGVRGRAEARPFLDAPVVARMKAAGAILIGRSNMSELGLRLSTDNPLRGLTRNPLNSSATAGGSSGGDAVAVATGMTPLGIGSDLGGSLRVPAHCCGVLALKPTTGRIPHASSLAPEDFGMAGQAMFALGPLARSVADLRVCLSVLAGRDIRDPRSVDVPLAGTAPLERRVALVTTLGGARIPTDVLAAIEKAGDILRDDGWTVERAEPPELERVEELWLRLAATDLSAIMPLVRPVVSDGLFEHVMRLCRAANLDEVSNNRLHEERSRLMRGWSRFFAEHAVVVGPNLTVPPWKHDADIDPQLGLDLLRRATRFVVPANALGLPVVALPMKPRGGSLVGIQIYADLWREDLCLEAASTIERALGSPSPIDPVE
ncbi:MAG: amidase family protein [Polyangiaceae bacterium]